MLLFFIFLVFFSYLSHPPSGPKEFKREYCWDTPVFSPIWNPSRSRSSCKRINEKIREVFAERSIEEIINGFIILLSFVKQERLTSQWSTRLGKSLLHILLAIQINHQWAQKVDLKYVFWSSHVGICIYVDVTQAIYTCFVSFGVVDCVSSMTFTSCTLMKFVSYLWISKQQSQKQRQQR